MHTFHFLADGWSFSRAFTVNIESGDIFDAYGFALDEFNKFCRSHNVFDSSSNFAVFYEDPLDSGESKLYHTFWL